MTYKVPETAEAEKLLDALQNFKDMVISVLADEGLAYNWYDFTEVDELLHSYGKD